MIGQAPKISIIGMGKVGSAIAFSILIKGLGGEMVLVDFYREAAEGDALDLLHASPFAHPIEIRAGDYDDTRDSDVVIICASIPSKGIQSRLDLCQGNATLFREIIPQIVAASPEAILLIITNPLDIMTHAALKISGFPAARVLGTGTLIDSGRFRSLLAAEAKIHPDEIHAYILGEHGDSQFPVLSQAGVGSVPFSERSAGRVAELFEQARQGGYMVMKKKGFTNYAIALATATIVEAIVQDRRKIYPVSTRVEGYYGLQDLCLSVPAIIGSGGVLRTVPVELNEEEQKALRKSAAVLEEIIRSLQL